MGLGATLITFMNTSDHFTFRQHAFAIFPPLFNHILVDIIIIGSAILRLAHTICESQFFVLINKVWWKVDCFVATISRDSDPLELAHTLRSFDMTLEV